MSKLAHITIDPNLDIGDRTIGVCGKEFKVKILWADVPKDKPICRDCVDTALTALTEADGVIEAARMHAMLIARRFRLLTDALLPEMTGALLPEGGLKLDAVSDQLAEFRERQEEARAAAETCTCRWVDGYRDANPECRVHTSDE